MALDYLGVTLEEWLQRLDHDEFIHPDDLERLKAAEDRALSTGSPFELELRLRKGDGSYRWFLARFNPVRDDKGKVMRWYAASTDIENRKRAEEKLQQENAALREEVDETSMFEEIVGTSPALKKVLSHISKVAPAIPRSLSRVKLEQVKNWLHARSTGDQLVRRAPSSA